MFGPGLQEILLQALRDFSKACERHRTLTIVLLKNINWLLMQPRPTPHLKQIALRIFVRLIVVRALESKIDNQYSFLTYEMLEADDDRFFETLDVFQRAYAVDVGRTRGLRKKLVGLLVGQYGVEIEVEECWGGTE